MPDLDIVGTAAVDIVPVVPRFHEKLKAAVLPIADRVGLEAGRKMGERMGEALRASLAGEGQQIGTSLGHAIADAMARQIAGAIPDAIRDGGRRARVQASRQGSDAGGAFATSIRRKLEAAFRAMPRLDVRLSDTGVDAELARIRSKLESLSTKRIGVDVGAEAASAEVSRLEEQLRRLGAAHPNVAVRVDTAAARAALAEIREEIAATTARPGQVRIEVDGSFGARLRAAVASAQAALPEITINADTTPAQVELQRLRAELASLADARVGIDIDAAAASARIDEIRARLLRLSAQDADVAVRVDAGKAAADLAAVGAMAEALDMKRVDVKVDTRGAVRSLLVLSVAIGGVAAIPALPVIAAGLGAVTSAAVAAGAGLGGMALVAVPAIKRVTEVMQAKKAAADEDTRATSGGAQASVQAAQRAMQLASAQEALGQAHRSAAKSISAASRAVEDAERSVADAQQRAADQRRQSAQNVARAQQSLADAQRSVIRAEESLTDSHRGVVRAEQQLADSGRGVVRSERDLSDAQKDARQAQADLTAARKTAAQQLADLDDQLRDGQLDQRDATLRLLEAQQELTASQSDPRSTQLQRDRAQLAFEQAQQHLKEQSEGYADLQKSAEDQKKAGVEGSKVVTDAQEALTQAQRKAADAAQGVADAQRAQSDAAQGVVDAQRGVRDAAQGVADAQRTVREQTQGVADAQREASRLQVEAAQRVTDAQRGLSDAVKGVADAQVDAAQSIRSAERGVESARMSGIDTTTQAITAQDKYRAALAKLTPEQRDLYDSIAGPRGLKSAFSDWSEALQPEVLPLFTRGVKGATKALPSFTPIVVGAARGVKRLMDAASRQLRNPFWRGFKKDIQDNTEPAVYGLGVAFGNVLKGIAGVIDAFLPHMDDIAGRLAKNTKSFADWGANLKGSPGFEKFLRYASDKGPIVWDTIQKIGGAFLDVGQALSPLSGPLLEIIGGLAQFIGTVAETFPFAIQLLWGLVVVTKAWALIQAILNAELFANPIGLVVLAIVALVAIIVTCYKKVGWFRKGVDTAWAGIKIATDLVWGKVLKPVFDLWIKYLKWLGEKYLWVWRKAVKPVLDLIAAAWHRLYDKHVKPVVDAMGRLMVRFYADRMKWLHEKISNILKLIGTAFHVLYDKAVRPAMKSSGAVVETTWTKVMKPAFKSIRTVLKLTSDAFKVAKDAISKHWGKLKKATKDPVNFIIKYTYTNGIKALWDGVAKFAGLSKLPKAPKLLEAGGTVGDGWGKASPMKVNRPTAIVGEGNPRYPEYVIPTDPKYRGRAKAMHQAAGTQLLEKGGVIGALEKGFDWAKTGADLLVHPKKIWQKLTSPVLGAVKDGVGGSGKWSQLLTALPKKMVAGLTSKLVGAVESMGGDWAKPVSVPYGTRFGVAGRMWSSGRHTGLDFPAAVGTAIKAVADGVVTQTSTTGPYGKHVMLNHGGGLQSLYAHMSKILTAVGSRVNRGQKIGEVGATGNVTGPHLHLEARQNGRSVDPMPYLTGGGGAGGKGVERWRGVVNQALSLTGNPKSAANVTLRRMSQESGGNPRAVNLWDTNATLGYPSTGLMQLIRPTWQHYAGQMKNRGPFMNGVSVDPLANVFASMKYAKSAYGSLQSAYGRPGGYAAGGFPELGETAWVGEHGPELLRFLTPTQVYSAGDSRALVRDVQAARTAQGGTTDVRADVRVFVGDREITDIVRTEVVAREHATAQALTYGRS